MNESRINHLSNIRAYAIDTHSGNSTKDWAQHPTAQQRALALAAKRLQHYQDQGDTQAVSDTKWAIKQIKTNW